MTRILFISGYSHPSHHRKIELLADNPDFEILHIVQPGNGKTDGRYASANGQHSYTVRVVPVISLGRANDPHRTIHWPPNFSLRQFRPQLIHCEHEQESLMTAQIALSRSLLAPGTPLILYSWQNILRQRKLAVKLISQFTLRSAQHIMCASQEGVSVLTRQGFKGGYSVIPLFGLDTRYFYPEKMLGLRSQLALPDNGFTVGYIGRLVADKGIDTLLQAASTMTVPIRLLIIGSGPEKEALQQLSHRLGLAQQCYFIDAVPYDLINDYMNLLDLLVLPSKTTPHWKEQFGRVMVEAMACKVAVAGSDSGAIPEVINNPEAIFPEGDTLALSRIIGMLATNLPLRQNWGEQGYQRVMENYTVEKLAQKISQVWQSFNL